MDVTGSSSGYHRAELVNLFITKFFDWWLVGTKDNGSWGWSMFDTSNTYVHQGESGGLLAFIFFLTLIVRLFSRLGRSRKAATSDRQEWLIWLTCSCLFANIVAFFGICYWDQTEVVWLHFMIAMICATTTPLLKPQLSFKTAEVGADLASAALHPLAVSQPEPKLTESVSRYLFK